MTSKIFETTETKHAPFFVRSLNPIIRSVLRAGFPAGPMTLLTVRGRKSGQPRTTPVGLFKVNGRRYLFSTFGRVNWVYNLRDAHEATLSHGRHKETLAAIELPPEVAAPILRDAFAPYLASFLMRPMLSIWYGAGPDTTLDGFVKVAQNHPVFELREEGH